MARSRTRKPSSRPARSPAPELGRRWQRNPNGYRYVKYNDRDVAPMPAGPLFKDGSSRRKFLHRLSRADVSTGARAWGQHLATRSGDNGHYCFGNQERFAAEMGRSVDSIQRYTAELEGAGLIVVERAKPYRSNPTGPYTRRWSNRYHFVVHVTDHLRYKFWWGIATYDPNEAPVFYQAPTDAPPEPRTAPGGPNAPPGQGECESPQDDATSTAEMSASDALKGMREMMRRAAAGQ